MGYKNFKNKKKLLKIPNNPPLLAKILRIAIPPKNIFLSKHTMFFFSVF